MFIALYEDEEERDTWVLDTEDGVVERIDSDILLYKIQEYGINVEFFNTEYPLSYITEVPIGAKVIFNVHSAVWDDLSCKCIIKYREYLGNGNFSDLVSVKLRSSSKGRFADFYFCTKAMVIATSNVGLQEELDFARENVEDFESLVDHIEENFTQEYYWSADSKLEFNEDTLPYDLVVSVKSGLCLGDFITTIVARGILRL